MFQVLCDVITIIYRSYVRMWYVFILSFGTKPSHSINSLPRKNHSPRDFPLHREGGKAEEGESHHLQKKSDRTGLRHAVVVCSKVTERTKERLAQSKRARAGSLAIVD